MDKVNEHTNNILLRPMGTTRVSIRLLEKAVQERWIRQLAFYYMVKSHYVNSCIFNYKNRMNELADKFNLSAKSVYNYLKELRKYGLLYDHENNLIFKSTARIKHLNKERYIKCIITIKSDHTIKDVECLLFAKILEQQAKKSAFAESLRRFRRGDRLKDELRASPFKPSFSIRTVAKLLNISENKAISVIKRLNELEVIRSIKQRPKLLFDNTGRANLTYLEDMPGYRFVSKNRLYEMFGCLHEFLQFPPKLKNITIRQLKILNNK
ncbi:MAG TPA: hypothetical protein VMW76_09680 [Bacteroidales bacterium]|nr:hypothetical protein [Bacteroidales bacterium]